MHVGGIFPKKPNAFDSVNHEICLTTLHLSDIQVVSAYWFMFHVTNRKQTVEIKEFEAIRKFFPNWGSPKHGGSRRCNSWAIAVYINHLTPNGHYMGRTAQLTSRCCILYIYSTNIRTEYFKHAA